MHACLFDKFVNTGRRNGIQASSEHQQTTEFVVIPQIVTEHNHLVNIIFTWWLTFEKDYESLGNTHKL